MSTLSDIREGIKTVLEAANSGLKVYAYEPDEPMETPCLVVEPTGDIDYELNLAGNSFEMTVIGTLYVVTVSNAEGWAELDKYRSPTGTESIKAGILTDKTLAGSVDDSECSMSHSVTKDRNAMDSFWQFSCRFDLHFIVSVT